MSTHITLGELASRLEQLERGANQQGPFVRSLTGKPVSGASEMIGRVYASAIRADAYREVLERGGVQELRTWTLRNWGEDVSSTSVHRVIGELLRRDSSASVVVVEAYTVTRAIELLNTPSSADAQQNERGTTVAVQKPVHGNVESMPLIAVSRLLELATQDSNIAATLAADLPEHEDRESTDPTIRAVHHEFFRHKAEVFDSTRNLAIELGELRTKAVAEWNNSPFVTWEEWARRINALADATGAGLQLKTGDNYPSWYGTWILTWRAVGDLYNSTPILLEAGGQSGGHPKKGIAASDDEFIGDTGEPATVADLRAFLISSIHWLDSVKPPSDGHRDLMVQKAVVCANRFGLAELSEAPKEHTLAVDATRRLLEKLLKRIDRLHKAQKSQHQREESQEVPPTTKYLDVLEKITGELDKRDRIERAERKITTRLIAEMFQPRGSGATSTTTADSKPIDEKTPPPSNASKNADVGKPQTGSGKSNDSTDGPFDSDGFRFAGVEVRFGRAGKQYRLVMALWDSEKNRPTPPRSIQDVITEVWGEDNDTEDTAFRKLCSDVRARFQPANCPLDVVLLNGTVQLKAR